MLLAAMTATWPERHAAAQSPPCTAIQNDAERLACYDRALRATSPAPAAPASAAPAPTASSAPAAQAPAAPVTQAPAPAAQTPAAQAPAAQAPAAPAAQSSNADKIMPVVVVTVRTLPGRETTFTTKDGAMWVQTDSQRIYGLPDTPFDAELKPGAVGSTFLVPKVGGRAIRVKLVER